MQFHYDGRNDVCPLPLVKVKRLMKTMQPGDVLIAITTDPGSKQNLSRWLERQCYSYDMQLLELHQLQWTITR